MSSPREQRAILGLAAPAVPWGLLRPGDYLTDESFLFRVVGRVPANADGTLELEDCYRLDVVRVRIDDLANRPLRQVIPAAARLDPPTHRPLDWNGTESNVDAPW